MMNTGETPRGVQLLYTRGVDLSTPSLLNPLVFLVKTIGPAVAHGVSRPRPCRRSHGCCCCGFSLGEVGAEMGRKNKNKFKKQDAKPVVRSFADIARVVNPAALATTVKIEPTVLAASSTKVSSPEARRRMAAGGDFGRGVAGRVVTKVSQVAKKMVPRWRPRAADHAAAKFNWSGNKMGTKMSFFDGLGRKTGALKPRSKKPFVLVTLAMVLALAGWQGWNMVSSVRWSEHFAWASPTRWLDAVSGRDEVAKVNPTRSSSSQKGSQHGISSKSGSPEVVRSDVYWTRGAAFGDGKVKLPKSAAERQKIVQKERAFRKLPVNEKRKVWQDKLARINMEQGNRPGVQTASMDKKVARGKVVKTSSGKKVAAGTSKKSGGGKSGDKKSSKKSSNK